MQRQSPDGLLKNPQLRVSAGSDAKCEQAGSQRCLGALTWPTSIVFGTHLPTTLRRLRKPFGRPMPPSSCVRSLLRRVSSERQTRGR
jgi:hypothetical protein